MPYLYEFESENRRHFNKILIILLVVASALLGFIFYVNYSELPLRELAITEITCETNLASSFTIDAGAGSFDELKAAIEENRGYKPNSLVYKSMSNTVHCNNNGAGLWFENPVDRKRFVYCLDPFDGNVVEFDINSCSKLDDADSIQRSIDEAFDAFGDK